MYRAVTPKEISNALGVDQNFTITRTRDNVYFNPSITGKQLSKVQHLLDRGVLDVSPEALPQSLDEWINIVRIERNKRLAESDWTQVPDVALSAEKQEEWAIYRKQLRDITGEITEIGQIDWPKLP